MSSRYDIYIYIYIYFWPKAKCTLIHSLWPECPRPVARILTAFCLWPEQAQPLAISLLQLYRKNITYYVLWLKVGPGGAHQCCFFSGLMTSPLLFLHQPEAHSELPTAACHALLSQSPQRHARMWDAPIFRPIFRPIIIIVIIIIIIQVHLACSSLLGRSREF